MPLILMCGLPSSGKTTLCEKIKEFITNNKPETLIRVVSDSDSATFSHEVFKESPKEKEQRGYLRSEVQKHLSRDQLVIVDSMNYIKGFRYELFCIAKNAKTSYCVVYCNANPTVIRQFNQSTPVQLQYTDELLEALTLRFEPPDSRNRWDSPLFIVNQPTDEMHLEEISACLFEGKVLVPNQSTQSQPMAATNFLYELDRICQSIVLSLVGEMKTAMPGDELKVPGSETKVRLTRLWSLADLNRFKRQFINYTKMNPIEDVNKLANMFVTFLNNMS